ncbi:Glutamine-dependent NAD(+) synthetase [Porphyridium purpureum]|uniref:Glutamine-dependent NAD(+) synthetase n=1 Tax=Porphyridium purpureum TaxID=35688 RepID=A0A5J4Z5L9_PORPP|nr:Glutamine-dependent NAD(+) synthetase [Porphyridium purpureum]|eukprot:POR5425..scf295_1
MLPQGRGRIARGRPMEGVSRVVSVAAASLNQWSLDFTGNASRIEQSIAEARAVGARYRVGGELEVCGYGCEDHFFEPDTFTHSWEVLAALCERGCFSSDMLIDIGMPVMHRGASYNARVLIVQNKIQLIRPKMWLADDGNYRESRWFRAWPSDRGTESFLLPACVQSSAFEQDSVPIGNAILQLKDCALAIETCEELFVPQPPHVQYGLHGVDLISNGSGSHHSLRKLSQRLDLITSATKRIGGAYIYANLIGCDGGRLYYDGCNLVVINGHVLAQGEQFSVERECFITVAHIDLAEVERYRSGVVSRGAQAALLSAQQPIPRINVCTADGALLALGNIARAGDTTSVSFLRQAERVSRPLKKIRLYLPEEEIALGPACWLWDYLRRSNMRGFLLPLSGGADSAATATLVASMCSLVFAAIEKGHLGVLHDLRRLVRKTATLPPNQDKRTIEERQAMEEWVPRSPQEIAEELFVTVYLGSENMSSTETRNRARRLSQQIGAFHLDLNIWPGVEALLQVFASAFPAAGAPKFKVHGGSHEENQALQNIQARIRMVVAYLLAQLTPWARGQTGTLLVLGSANVDEALRGYLTKYDCSSADINPIGGISKTDLKAFLRWASTKRLERDSGALRTGVLGGGLGLTELVQILEAPPTAELEPITATYTQTDEIDMGMTYEELSMYGKLRKIMHSGPVSMYFQLLRDWAPSSISPRMIAEKVKFFFRMYGINRHKMTTLTPSYHAESYSPDDNRFDLRQFLYNPGWTWQFARIDLAAKALEEEHDQSQAERQKKSE